MIKSLLSRRAQNLILFALLQGTIFAQTPKVLYGFGTPASPPVTPAIPESTLTEVTPGVFYGTTLVGGADGCGTIFKVTSAGVFTKLHDLTFFEGCAPTGKLVKGPGGALYGTTMGSPFNPKRNSSLFKTDLTGNVTELFSFTNAFRHFIQEAGPVTIASDGSLYVVVNELSASLGVEFFTSGFIIYRLAPDGTSSIVGKLPSQTTTPPLSAANDGNLYGAVLLTDAQTKNQYVAIIRVNATAMTVIAAVPTSGPMVAFTVGIEEGIDNRLYVVTSNNLFSLDLDGRDVQMIEEFSPTSGCAGLTPVTGLTRATDGSLYGGCGSYNLALPASIYRVSANGTYTDLLTFPFPAGTGFPGSPSGLAVEGSDGLLYGLVSSTDAMNNTAEGFLYSLDVGLSPKN